MKLRTAYSLVLVSFALSTLPARARAWEWFRSENSDVLKGNEQLDKGQLDKAIAAYSDAAKSLPQEGGVHLDRGIALLKSGKLTEARDALLIASQGKASADVRAKAHYNLGLAFLQEADAAAKGDPAKGGEDLEAAQKLLREASDAFKSSLRAGPKNRDAAWNLELAKRRMVELEKKQQEKKDQEKKDQEKKDQEKKDQDEQQKNEDQDKSEDQEKGEGDDQKKDEPKDASDKPDAGAPPEPKAGEDAGAPEQPKPDKPQPEEPEQADKPQPALPEHMQKALDALEDSEENLQKHQAATRARQQPRRIEKDW